jgi:phosphoribosyl 1,2-cyclic phosphodiesterase
MQVTFWGVRGSHPVPGPETVRYGGHTSCIEVCSARGSRVILDAGTGIRALGHKLALERAGAPSCRIDLVLSHVHWDHIQGLPFFQPAYLPGTRIVIHAHRTATAELDQVIKGITRHEFFPVPLEAVPASFEFREVSPGTPFAVGDLTLHPIGLNHPFGATGYRIDGDGASFAYVSDTAPFTDVLHKQHFLAGPEEPSADDRRVLAAMRDDLVDLLAGVDTVVFDTHFLPEEYARFPHWGHSTPDHALDLVRGLRVRRLVLFHHAPAHTDAMMDTIGETYRARGASDGIDVVVAREGARLEVGVQTRVGVGP